MNLKCWGGLGRNDVAWLRFKCYNQERKFPKCKVRTTFIPQGIYILQICQSTLCKQYSPSSVTSISIILFFERFYFVLYQTCLMMFNSFLFLTQFPLCKRKLRVCVIQIYPWGSYCPFLFRRLSYCFASLFCGFWPWAHVPSTVWSFFGGLGSK